MSGNFYAVNQYKVIQMIGFMEDLVCSTCRPLNQRPKSRNSSELSVNIYGENQYIFCSNGRFHGIYLVFLIFFRGFKGALPTPFFPWFRGALATPFFRWFRGALAAPFFCGFRDSLNETLKTKYSFKLTVLSVKRATFRSKAETLPNCQLIFMGKSMYFCANCRFNGIY